MTGPLLMRMILIMMFDCLMMMIVIMMYDIGDDGNEEDDGDDEDDVDNGDDDDNVNCDDVDVMMMIIGIRDKFHSGRLKSFARIFLSIAWMKSSGFAWILSGFVFFCPKNLIFFFFFFFFFLGGGGGLGCCSPLQPPWAVRLWWWWCWC